MNTSDKIRLVIGALIAVIALIYFVIKTFLKHKKITTSFITRSAVIAAFATILYCVPALKFPLPIFPNFLEIHLDEIPLLIAGFAYGPWSAIFALAIKTIIKFPMSNTLFVGELADFLYSLAFIIPSALFYKKHRKFSGALIALGIGTVCQLIVASVFTTYVMLDFYMAVMGLSKSSIMSAVANAGISINNLGWEFMVFVSLPFNALKDAMVLVVTILLYKKMHQLLEKIK
ncbi:MAG: ECF transporter S component [Bacilli bacterium]|nr:ECF transporter S component [Bacilli bacterium]